ncbi:hypothetical protein GX441_08595 [bacterium]|nr:hypothetical protein [bacterium]
MRKILIAAIAVALILAASPAMAQLAGVWEGTGKGNCYPRNSTVIYPWQQWKGEIPATQTTFSGTWNDSLGNHGTFKGKIEFSPIPELAKAKGSWYWFDPLGPSTQPVYGGDFVMDFWFTMNRCNGNWTTIWPSTSAEGTMKGWKVWPD